MAKPYDASSKQLFDLSPVVWLALAGLPLPRAGGAVTVVDADLSTVTAAPDKLIRVDAGPLSYLAHFDYQSSPDPSFDARMFMYNAVGRWRHGLPVRSAAFLLRPEAMTPALTGRVVDWVDDDVRLEFAYRVIRVWELPVEPLLNGPVATLPLAPIAAVARGDVPAVVAQVQRRLTTDPDVDRPADVWFATRLLLGGRYGFEFLEAMMVDLLNYPESSFWQHIMQKGRTEGRADGARHLLLRMATDRFGAPPPPVAARLQAVTDVDEIERIASRLPTASGWSDLIDD